MSDVTSVVHWKTKHDMNSIYATSKHHILYAFSTFCFLCCNLIYIVCTIMNVSVSSLIGRRHNIMKLSSQHRNCHYRDVTACRPSYLHNRTPYTCTDGLFTEQDTQMIFIFAPFFVQFLLYDWVPGTVFGILSLSAAALTPLCPETHGRSLPSTIEEIANWSLSLSSEEKEMLKTRAGRLVDNKVAPVKSVAEHVELPVSQSNRLWEITF